MNRNLRQLIVQSNREAAAGVAPPVDVAPQDAVVARRRDGHDDLLGWGGEQRRCRGGEEVADAGEVAATDGSDGEADAAARERGGLRAVILLFH